MLAIPVSRSSHPSGWERIETYERQLASGQPGVAPILRDGRGLKQPLGDRTIGFEVVAPILRDGRGLKLLVQYGTNLSMIRLAADAEGWLGKPVIATNIAARWRAYRASGFLDRVYGFGSLLRNH